MDSETTKFAKHLAKILVAACVRRGELEGLHAGIVPTSNKGDFSDVYVVDAEGNKIPWNDVSRISQGEMKALMIGTVDRTYTFMTRTILAGKEDIEFETAVSRAVVPWTTHWDEPRYLPYFLMMQPPDER
ncbi:hypothetical protein [Asticcacaulis benevestitus]|uniref:Uncharacterized protein n=1 Tax=Asticcacaulis benevestitus DSM 16100 = ATCC BAA-896 TaxID=1121022 RepID=V4PVX2_9CAUL|nr:hypothetical protein [Asticcacaulis benevestitus]ESQ92536.1 hypothetical protein ABENE_07825 [Asticcacaulis benevestitus DSM 16100 = ATCC BAA-896]